MVCVKRDAAITDATAENEVESLVIWGILSEMRALEGQDPEDSHKGPQSRICSRSGGRRWFCRPAPGQWLARAEALLAAQQALL